MALKGGYGDNMSNAVIWLLDVFVSRVVDIPSTLGISKGVLKGAISEMVSISPMRQKRGMIG